MKNKQQNHVIKNKSILLKKPYLSSLNLSSVIMKIMMSVYSIFLSGIIATGGEVIVNQTFELDKHGSGGGWSRMYFSDKCAVMVTEAEASPTDGGEKSYMIQRHKEAKNGWLHQSFIKIENPFELSVDIKMEKGTESFVFSIFSEWTPFIQLYYDKGSLKNVIGRGPGERLTLMPFEASCWYRLRLSIASKVSEAGEYNLTINKLDGSDKALEKKEFENLRIFSNPKTKDPLNFVNRLKIDIAPGGEILIDNLEIKKL
jgi:hypothetical protein